MNRLLAALFTFISAASLAQKVVTPNHIQEFDQYVEAVRRQWDIPGMSITVVRNNQVIFKKGYGVRELGTSRAVDTQTLFACASTTKAMTVALMGMLVDEGKLAWHDPVAKYLPDMQLYDPAATRELTVRDLLIHDTGVGGTDFFTSAMTIPVNEMLKRLALVKPSYSLRSGFIYQNTMYSAAGRIIERITGKTWSTVIRERLFTPLGMTRTVPKRQYINDDNLTKPHFNVNDTIRVIDYGVDSEIGSAGAVWSCADDISRWVICMLDSSKYSGGRLLKPGTWAEIFKPQTLVPEDEYETMQLLKPNWFTYGLGWYQHDYKGHKVNFHTGSLAGLTAITAQLPDEKLGVFVFGNYDHAEGRHALVYKTLDWFALGGTRDWNSDFFALYARSKEQAKKRAKLFQARRVANTAPSHPLQAYAGRYSSPLYGSATIAVSGNELSINVNDVLLARLPHWHFDTFYGPYQKAWYGKAMAQFSLNAEGAISRLVFDGMTFAKD